MWPRGKLLEDERGWTAFATNVGKARIMRHDQVELRLRWAGAMILVFVVLAGGFLIVRYYGLRAGWWTTLLPSRMEYSARRRPRHAWSWKPGSCSRLSWPRSRA